MDTPNLKLLPLDFLDAQTHYGRERIMGSNSQNELGSVGVADHDDAENVVVAGPPSAAEYFYHRFEDPDFILKTMVVIATRVSEARLGGVAEITSDDVHAAFTAKGIHVPKTASATNFPSYDETFTKRVWKYFECARNCYGYYGPTAGAVISSSAFRLFKMVEDDYKNPTNFHAFGTLEKLKILTAASNFETFPLPPELVSQIHCFEGGRLLVLASPTTGVTARISEYNWIIDDDDNEEDEDVEEWTLDEENELVGDVEYRWCEDTWLCLEE